MCRYRFYDLKVLFWWPNKRLKCNISSWNTLYTVYKVIFSCAKARDPSPFFVDNKAKRASYVCTYYNRGGQKSEGETWHPKQVGGATRPACLIRGGRISLICDSVGELISPYLLSYFYLPPLLPPPCRLVPSLTWPPPEGHKKTPKQPSSPLPAFTLLRYV